MLRASMKERWTEDKEVERGALAALVDGGALWANRPSNENAKVSKKLRLIAQNSGHVARSMEHQFFFVNH